MQNYVLRILAAAWLALVFAEALPRPKAVGQAAPKAVGQAAPKAPGQTALGPGLYVFQTRTRGSSCGDSERDGYVMSFFAAINGVPGSTSMTMELVNTPHFTNWALTVSVDVTLTGKSRIGTAAGAPDAQFTVTRDDDRWKGTGFRTYNGKLNGQPVRCRVDFDALLRRIDTRPQPETTTE